MGWQGFFTSSCTKGPGLSFGSRYRQNTPFRIAALYVGKRGIVRFTARCSISGSISSFNSTDNRYTEEKSLLCNVGYTIADKSSLYQSLCTFTALSAFILSLLLVAILFTSSLISYDILIGFRIQQRRQPFGYRHVSCCTTVDFQNFFLKTLRSWRQSRRRRCGAYSVDSRCPCRSAGRTCRSPDW